jgi:branched-chain amino acid transport system substrate-binding protein
MTKPQTKIAVATAAALAAVSLSACGGVAAQQPGGQTSTSGGETYKLGLIAPFSGSENMFGNYMKYGAQLAVNEINEAGGVLGKQL